MVERGAVQIKIMSNGLIGLGERGEVDQTGGWGKDSTRESLDDECGEGVMNKMVSLETEK